MVTPKASFKNITASSRQHQVKGDKYVVLQKGSSSKLVRQKIVIDSKTGRAYIILTKTPEAVSESILPIVQKKRETVALPSLAKSSPPKIKLRLEPFAVTVPARAQCNQTSALDNFEDLMPSTAIVQPTNSAHVVVRPVPSLKPEHSFPAVQSSVAASVNKPARPVSAARKDSNLLVMPGEQFGGPAASFYLCVKDGGTLKLLDNRPLVREGNRLVPIGGVSGSAVAVQPPQRNILEVAISNSNIYQSVATHDRASDFSQLNTNVSAHAYKSKTSSALDQPTMLRQKLPRTAALPPSPAAVTDVTPQTAPTSLELPIKLTDPTPRLPDPTPAPVSAPLSMPLLPDEEESFVAAKSMPILTID